MNESENQIDIQKEEEGEEEEGEEEEEEVITEEDLEAELLEDRIIVWNPKVGSWLYKHGYYGKPVGIRKPKHFNFTRPLELSLLESTYLLSINKLRIKRAISNKPISYEELKRIGELHYDRFTEKFLVYTDLRKKGYVVRPGLKFGADFAIYEHGPGIDHSPLIVHVLSRGVELSPIELVRAGRLATTVRKKFTIATVPPDGTPRYFMFSWFKP
ncbi:tRNA-intron lyase [Candidatus Borrarchaeum sp.]|uniref:tRNA-intron lyase n=1 Tax=Candidatus Borrarchaeum sp. TaxID=2846742 RepID=UPI0025798F4D|nr:tRNA-intron lyase [Candidatus Borrarchaeum sp.]